jgi:glutamine amidotransferase
MIAIIDYNAGNTGSVQNALDRLGYQSLVTSNAEVIANADKVILPGVGEAGTAMAELNRKGLVAIIRDLNQPVLGICLGLQLLCRYSMEGETDCIGIFDSVVNRLPKQHIIPHTGWNNLENMRGELFRSVKPGEADVYFVHSYYAAMCTATVASCNYVLQFSAALQQGNFYATQFHPEKSADIGELILKNFMSL